MRSTVTLTPACILEPSGYITAANAHEFQKTLTEAIDSDSHSTYLVDMQGVEFLDSAGLMALVSAFRLAQSRGKRFSLCSLKPSVRIIFELTQVERVLEIFDSRGSFAVSEPGRQALAA